MYGEWTTEVPQISNANGQLRGGDIIDSASWYLVSCRSGYSSATLLTHWHVGFRLVLENVSLFF